MSWAEIKKAVNSNIDVPLNELIKKYDSGSPIQFTGGNKTVTSGTSQNTVVTINGSGVIYAMGAGASTFSATSGNNCMKYLNIVPRLNNYSVPALQLSLTPPSSGAQSGCMIGFGCTSFLTRGTNSSSLDKVTLATVYTGSTGGTEFPKYFEVNKFINPSTSWAADNGGGTSNARFIGLSVLEKPFTFEGKFEFIVETTTWNYYAPQMYWYCYYSLR